MRYQPRKKHEKRFASQEISSGEQASAAQSEVTQTEYVAEFTPSEERMVGFIRRDVVRVLAALLVVAVAFGSLVVVGIKRPLLLQNIGQRLAQSAGLKK